MSDKGRPTWQPKLLVGRAEVAEYLQVHINTLDRWVKHRGFPMCPLPSGRLATSYWLIDAWLQARGNEYRRIRDEREGAETNATN
jgi:hypothetical protein